MSLNSQGAVVTWRRGRVCVYIDGFDIWEIRRGRWSLSSVEERAIDYTKVLTPHRLGETWNWAFLQQRAI